MKNTQAGNEVKNAEETTDYGLAEFLAMIVHDDRDSIYHIARHDPKADSPRPWRGYSRGAKKIFEYDFAKGYEWFVTRNGFISKKSRKREGCRQLNAVLCDVDFHRAADPAYDVACALELIEAGWHAGRVPEPTMLLTTGRGLHLYYALEHSTPTLKTDGTKNASGCAFFDDVQGYVADAVERYLVPLCDNVEVDRSVFDYSRVARVPGTINPKSGTRCEVVYNSKRFYELSELKAASMQGRGLTPASKPTTIPSPRRDKPRRMHDDRWLSESRIKRLTALRDNRGERAHGHRELMCFVFYNAAVQVFESRSDAFSELTDYNRGFDEPLENREIEGIRRSVDKVGFYRLNRKKVVEMLALDDDEQIAFFKTKREEQRAVSKLRTSNRRKSRDRGIRFLARPLKHDKAQIAAIMGCCEKTCTRALNENDTRECMPLDEATKLLITLKRIASTTIKNTVDKKFPAKGAQVAETGLPAAVADLPSAGKGPPG